MIKKFIDYIMRTVEIICMLLLATAVAFVTMQIVFRYFLSSPLGWTEQSSRFCFIWIVMLGIPIMFHRKCEISFDYLLEKLNGRAHDAIMFLFEILGIFFCAVYFVFSIQLCIRTGGRMTSGVAIPLNCLYAAQPASAFLTILVFIGRISEKLKKEVCK